MQGNCFVLPINNYSNHLMMFRSSVGFFKIELQPYIDLVLSRNITIWYYGLIMTYIFLCCCIKYDFGILCCSVE